MAEKDLDKRKLIAKSFTAREEEVEELSQDITKGLLTIQEKRLEFTKKELEAHLHKPFIFFFQI